MRKIYLDNIRWITVLLVMFYHVIYMFNAVGVMGGVGSFRKVQYQDGILYVYAWFMTLAVLGCGRKWLNRQNRFSVYMAKAGLWKVGKGGNDSGNGTASPERKIYIRNSFGF